MKEVRKNSYQVLFILQTFVRSFLKLRNYALHGHKSTECSLRLDDNVEAANRFNWDKSVLINSSIEWMSPNESATHFNESNASKIAAAPPHIWILEFEFWNIN